MLHAVYAVEKFLHGLLHRKCNFHIVFFDNHDTLCLRRDAYASGATKYLLTRDILVRHLQINLQTRQPSLQIKVFPSIQCENFTRYLAITGMYFLMCHDGASTGALSKNDWAYDRVYGNDEIDAGDRHTKFRSAAFGGQVRSKIGFRYMIYEFVRLGYNVALINGLEFRDTKVRLPSIQTSGLCWLRCIVFSTLPKMQLHQRYKDLLTTANASSTIQLIVMAWLNPYTGYHHRP